MKRIALALVVLVSMAVLAGCGGGGSGDKTTTATPYTINSTTAPEVVLMAEDLGSLSADFEKMIPMPPNKVGYGAASAAYQATPAGPMVAAVMDLMGGYTSMGKTYTAYNGGSFGPLTIYDQCGDGDGEAVLSGTVTQSGANFTVVFTNYTPDCQAYLNGTVTVSFTSTETSEIFAFTFSGLSMQMSDGDGNFTITMNGSIGMVQTSSTVTFTANYTVTDGVDTGTLTNFVIAADISYEPQVTYTVNGQIGWNGKTVSVSNVTPIVIADAENDDHPTSGCYIIDGNGKVKVTYKSTTTLQLDGDFDENGTWEWTTDVITWEAFYNMVN